MTIAQSIEVALNADIRLGLSWTRDGDPVELDDAVFTVQQGDVELRTTLGDGIEQIGADITITIPQAAVALSGLEPGAGEWDLIVESVPTGRERLLAGDVSIVAGSGSWIG